MIRTNINYTDFQIDRLKRLSLITGLNISELARRALDDYLDRHLGLMSGPPILDDIDTSPKEWFTLEELDAGLRKRGLLNVA